MLYSPILINLTEHGDPQSVMGQIVTGNYFSTLGIAPIIGRHILPSEDPARDKTPSR